MHSYQVSSPWVLLVANFEKQFYLMYIVVIEMMYYACVPSLSLCILLLVKLSSEKRKVPEAIFFIYKHVVVMEMI